MYWITSPRRSKQKSRSMSGMEMRSGFRNRSNSRSNLRGSISVMPSAYATSEPAAEPRDRKSTCLNSSHLVISYAVFCLKKKNKRTSYYTYPAPIGLAMRAAAKYKLGLLTLYRTHHIGGIEVACRMIHPDF